MRNHRGFSLLELVIILLVIAILSAVSIPAIMEWMPNTRFRGAYLELVTHLQLAKMEAIKRNANVVVLFKPVVCAGFPSAVPEPGGEYTIFVDNGSEALGHLKNNALDGDEVTLIKQDMPRDVALCDPVPAGALIPGPPPPPSFVGGVTGFLPTGLPIVGNGGSVTLVNNRGHAAAIVMTVTGELRRQ